MLHRELSRCDCCNLTGCLSLVLSSLCVFFVIAFAQLRSGGANTSSLVEHLQAPPHRHDPWATLICSSFKSASRRGADSTAGESAPVPAAAGPLDRFAQHLDTTDRELQRRRDLWLSGRDSRVRSWDKAFALALAVDLQPTDWVNRLGFRDIFLPACCPMWYVLCML